MALGANSYGDIDEIAALVPRRGSIGSGFTTNTRPTLLQLESIVDQVNAVVNAILAQAGFSIPVTNADAVLMLDLFVNQEAAAIVEGINGSGRFGPTAKKASGGRFAMITTDVKEFIMEQAVGLERLGATRTYDPIAGIGYRLTDNSGDSVSPIFQREGFGNAFDEWDS